MFHIIIVLEVLVKEEEVVQRAEKNHTTDSGQKALCDRTIEKVPSIVLIIDPTALHLPISTVRVQVAINTDTAPIQSCG